MNTICTENKCTGCRACVNICGKNAIHMEKTPLGIEVAKIDSDKCIGCKLCTVVCPQNNEAELNSPQNCYAAWSLDSTTRVRSASGGIAAEMYHWASEHNMWFAGVCCSDTCGVQYELTKDATRIVTFQNSKYVSSDTRMIYKEIAQKLKSGESTLFIGLPCQVAGLKKYCQTRKVSMEGLFLVDLICHGTAPNEYLKQHIHSIEERKHKTATEFSFRDPDTYTYTFTFTLKDHGTPFYAKRVESNDAYQIGYHKGIIYRENCYGCNYARMERTGDITLADFSYVGTRAECKYDSKNVSAVLVNSSKGEAVIRELKNKERIFCELRPMEEETDHEMMLHRPTPMPKERKIFVEEYSQTRDFETAMRKAVWPQMVKNELIQKSHARQIKSLISRKILKPIRKALKSK